jgi:hypothetical protein
VRSINEHDTEWNPTGRRTGEWISSDLAHGTYRADWRDGVDGCHRAHDDDDHDQDDDL